MTSIPVKSLVLSGLMVLVNPRRFASYLGSFGPVVVPPLSSVGPSGRIVFRFISDWLTFPAMSISGLIIDLLLRMNDQAHTTQTDTLIHQFGLDPTKKARTYSKGNRQKVALIAALSQEADFYIFDEPTSGLDLLNERLFQAAVLALKKRGKAVLLSSHILSEVERMCDRIGIIREGQIIETGSLAAMRYLTRTTVTVTLGDDFDVTTLPGLHAVTPGHAAGEWQFSVDADSLAATMTTLAEHHITALQSTPPTLEDLFMHYYAKE